ncbi:hypothetical protein [Nonomuraea jiangxiensis]|uniref:Uncharacterized protein n=1 Tax=Nonomuraea jiangxiensis TaxID=633440 RepID=A0A1G9IP08_9ACTN|nr:hypothetical protein [Nonomuraea jiangxiensis]SDL26860.1 hypothetical protein SAMN05421869_1243 [Nonomuraea jiangxiensis]
MAFAAAVRERAGQAWRALQAARDNDDVHATLVAEHEWEDIRRVARVHGVSLSDGGSLGQGADGRTGA